MYLPDAFEIFHNANQAEKVFNRETGGYSSISPSAEKSIQSTIRTALQYATGREDVESFDIRPYFEGMTEFARRYHEAHGLERPGNAAARAARFLATIEGGEWARCRNGEVYILPAWRPLYDFARSNKANRPEAVSGIQRLQVLAMVWGRVRDPHDLPSPDVLESWRVAGGLTKSQLGRMVDAYELARLGLAGVDPTLPCMKLSRVGQRGLMGLPDILDRLKASGWQKPLRETKIADALRVLAPRFAAALEETIEHPDHVGKGPGWKKSMHGAVSRILAELLLDGYDISVLTPFDLIERTVALAPTTAPASLAEQELVARGGGTGVKTTPSIPLLRHLLDHSAARSLKKSPLTLLGQDGSAKQGRQAGPGYYTCTVRGDFQHFKSLMETVYNGWAEAAPEAWEKIGRVLDATELHMRRHNKGKKLRGQKDKARLLRVVTYAQLVCRGLPALREKVLKRRRAYRRALAGSGKDAGCELVQRHWRAYVNWLRRYLVLAIMIDDGMRVKNYAGAIMGVHFIVTRGAGGAGIKFTTKWRGFDDPTVSLKIQRDENGAEKERIRQLTPGIVDHELLWEYLIKIRPLLLVEAGLLNTVQDFVPSNDHYALFVSRFAKNTAGRYQPSRLSTIFGRALHWICEKELRREVPEWKHPDRTTVWRGLFSAHVSRLLIATYWGGVRKDWDEACMLTDDTEETLRRSYSKVDSVMLAAKRQPGEENPHHFDVQIDHIFNRGGPGSAAA